MENKEGATKTDTPELEDDLRPDYDFDFSKGERGRYYKRLLAEGSSVVVLEPDLAAIFPSSTAVNAALRSLVDLARASADESRVSPPRVCKGVVG